MGISIVIPVYNEGLNLKENIRAIINQVKSKTNDLEIILVDDGSIDDTWDTIRKINLVDNRIKGVKFTRNFGKEAAIFAGLEKTRGKGVLVMDADLQHPPDLIPSMIEHWEKDHFPIVEGKKRKRGDKTFFTFLGASFFNWVFKSASGFDLKDSSDFKLMDRKVVDVLLQMREVNTFFRGMVFWSGFDRKVIEFDVRRRKGDKSKFTLLKLFKLATSSISSFSSVPLQIVNFIGFIFLLFAILLIGQTLYNYYTGVALTGFTTIIILILLTGSFIMIGLGVVGFYLSKIYQEIKSRPKFIIQERIGIEA